MFLSIVFTFCFNDPSTTEFYTYLHTRSLHGALPIYSSRRIASRSGPMSPSTRYDQAARGLWRARLCRLATRSEEHTSELQSIMRISYADFCLKKKKTDTDT